MITITEQPVTKLTMRMGYEIELRVKATTTSSNALRYQWYCNDKEVAVDIHPAAQKEYLVINNVRDPELFGVYYCVISETGGDSDIAVSNRAIVEEDKTPPWIQITDTIVDQTVDEDAPVTFTCDALTNERVWPMVYEWVHNFKTFAVTKTNTLTIDHTDPSHQGNWICIPRVMNVYAFSNKFNLTLTNKPFIRVIDQPEGLMVPADTHAYFSLGFISNFRDKVTFEWEKAEDSNHIDWQPIDKTQNPSAATPVLSFIADHPDQTIHYRCRLSFKDDPSYEELTKIAILQVGPALDITGTGITGHKADARPGEVVVLNANVEHVQHDARYPIHYEWKKDSVPIPDSDHETLNVVITEDSPASAKYMVVATTGPETKPKVYSSPEVTVSVDKSAATLNITAQPTAKVESQSGVDFSIFVDANTNDPSGIHYQWLKDGKPITGETKRWLAFVHPGPSASGSYICRMSAGIGQTLTTKDSDASVIRVADDVPTVIKISQQPQTQAKDLNSVTTLSVQATSNGHPIQVQWLKDDKPIKGATNPTLTIKDTDENAVGSYKAVLTSGEATTTTNAAKITLTPHDKIKSIESPEGEILKPGHEPHALTAKVVPVNPQDPVTYQWYKNDQVIQNETSATLNITGTQHGDLDKYYAKATVAGQTVQTRTAIVANTKATAKYYIHPLPARKAAFMWIGFWVLDEIEQAEKRGINWLADYEKLKYSDVIETIASGMNLFDVVELMESRNGYIIKSSDL